MSASRRLVDELPDIDVTNAFSAQKTKDLKWRIVCAGVQRLIEKEGLDEADVMLWFDWQSSASHGSSNPRPQRS